MLKLLHEVGRSVAVLHDNALLFVYRYGENWPKPHFHPLYAPASTRIITLHAPYDYVHHRGLMWSWGRVSVESRPDEWVDFWHERMHERDEDGRILWPRPLDDKHRGVIRHIEFQTLRPGRERAILRADQEWRRASDDSVLLHQQQTAIVHPTTESGWFFDLQYDMRAAGEPVILGQAIVDETSFYKSTPYGLGLHLSREFAGGALLNSNGQRGAKCSTDSAAWCDYSGPRDDDEEDDGWIGVTIMNHPSNPRHPTPFFALTGNTAFFAATPTEHEPLLVSNQTPLVFRYRIFVHHGRGEMGTLNRHYEEFVASPRD
jgi:Methane oxygenase PmoA